MAEGYSNHHDYLERISAEVDKRCERIQAALREAFASHIERHEVEVVVFSGMTVFDLARSIRSKPEILKSLLAACNVAARALERDLGIKNVDTYAPRLT